MKGTFCLTYEPEQQNNNIVRLDENIKQETMECHFFLTLNWNQLLLQISESFKTLTAGKTVILYTVLFLVLFN